MASPGDRTRLVKLVAVSVLTVGILLAASAAADDPRDVQVAEFRQAAEQILGAALSSDRITSYNVCYTKLLRSRSASRAPRR